MISIKVIGWVWGSSMLEMADSKTGKVEIMYLYFLIEFWYKYWFGFIAINSLLFQEFYECLSHFHLCQNRIWLLPDWVQSLLVRGHQFWLALSPHYGYHENHPKPSNSWRIPLEYSFLLRRRALHSKDNIVITIILSRVY